MTGHSPVSPKQLHCHANIAAQLGMKARQRWRTKCHRPAFHSGFAPVYFVLATQKHLENQYKQLWQLESGSGSLSDEVRLPAKRYRIDFDVAVASSVSVVRDVVTTVGDFADDFSLPVGNWGIVVDALTTDERAAAEAETFLETLYALVAKSKNDEAADLIYDHFQSLLRERAFPACGDIFRLAEPSRLSPSTLRSLLSITNRDKGSIWGRLAFADAAKAEIARRQDPVRAERLVGHLR